MADDTQKNKKVLVVEDETALLHALVDKLTREGFTALEAQDGAKGLEIALREKPDVILLDLVMPEMTGLDVLKGIRHEGDWGKSVPVIILTNLSMHERLLHEIAEQNPTDFLVKGESKIEEVIEKVKENLIT